MSRTNVRGSAQPGRTPRLARGRAARSVGFSGLFPPHHPAGGPGEPPDGLREQRVVAQRLSATTGQPP